MCVSCARCRRLIVSVFKAKVTSATVRNVRNVTKCPIRYVKLVLRRRGVSVTLQLLHKRCKNFFTTVAEIVSLLMQSSLSKRLNADVNRNIKAIWAQKVQ